MDHAIPGLRHGNQRLIISSTTAPPVLSPHCTYRCPSSRVQKQFKQDVQRLEQPRRSFCVLRDRVGGLRAWRLDVTAAARVSGRRSGLEMTWKQDLNL